MRVSQGLVGVVCSIDLDDHARANATEIHDVTGQDVLTPEVMPGELIVAQGGPELLLGRRGLAP